MANVQTQIRIDEGIKLQANELFNALGLDFSSAVNIFIRQCLLHNGLPFAVEVPRYKAEVLAAMDEAEKLSSDPNARRYANFTDLLADLDD